MLNDIDDFLRNTITGLESVFRWEHYVKLGATKENDLQHSFSTVVLTILVLEILRNDSPSISYDPYQILACAALHDFGEIGVGDTIYKNKTEETPNQELESYQLQISKFPDQIKDRLLEIYSCQYRCPDQPGNTIIFEFIERTGYIIYALSEYKRSKDNIFMLVQVLRNQLEHIKRILNIIPGCKILFTDQVISDFETILTAHDGLYLE